MKYLLILPSFFLCQFLFAQETTGTSTNLTSQKLTYHKEIPAVNSYKVIKNTTGTDEIPVEILEEINFHRRSDIDYKWTVSDEILILIYHIGKTVPVEAINTLEKDLN